MNTVLTCFSGACATPVYAFFAASVTGLGLISVGEYVINADF